MSELKVDPTGQQVDLEGWGKIDIETYISRFKV
jgi:hypothetical protein